MAVLWLRKPLQIRAQRSKLILYFAARGGRDSIIAGWTRQV
jgi:hypothetical protein